MSDKKCIACGFPKPATPKYFYRDKKMRGGLRGECKACYALARARREMKQRWTAGVPLRYTPRALKGTPEYLAFERRKHVIYQRIYRAQKDGRLHAIPRLRAWLQQVRDDWYGQIAQG